MCRGKPKTKTRGTPTPVVEEEPAAQPATPTPTREPVLEAPSSVRVSKRAAHIFAALLPGAGSLAHVGREISWDDFIYAMNDVGMRPEKLYGSVWAFRPCDGEERKVASSRPINFHEPKEVRRGSKIDQHMVRVLGRRLKYALGWNAEMFVTE